METGEYRGFAGQFSRWLQIQLATWRWPLLFSLLLHVGLLLPQSSLLSRLGAAKGVAMPGLHIHLKSEPEPARRAEGLPMSRPSLRPVPAMATSAAPPVSAPVPAGAEGTAASAGPFVSREPAENVNERTVSGGLDAGAVRIYRLALARAIRADALRARLPDPAFEGALALGLAVNAAGQLKGVAVVRSSGSAAVDAAVLAAVSEAARAAAIPPAMQGRDFMLELPVEIGAAATLAADR